MFYDMVLKIDEDNEDTEKWLEENKPKIEPAFSHILKSKNASWGCV